MAITWGSCWICDAETASQMINDCGSMDNTHKKAREGDDDD